MEIIKLKDDVYQLIDLSNDSIILQGAYNDCASWLANFARQEEEHYYRYLFQH